MAEPDAKKIRKNRTLYSRIEEVEEMYGREPTAFEHRALAEFPLKEQGKVRDLCDTSANGRRIHQLLEESEKDRDISLLEETGELLTIQAARNPYAIKELEIEVEEVNVIAAGIPYSEWLLCCAPPWRGRSRSPTSSPLSTTVHPQSAPPLQMNPPSTFSNGLPTGPSYAQSLPQLPPALPLPHPNYSPQTRNNLPIQSTFAPIPYSANVFEGTVVGEPPVLPHYNGWHQFQPQQSYPTTAPQAYSLANGSVNFNTFQTLLCNTSGMPTSNQANLKVPTSAQPLPTVPSSSLANPNSYQPASYQLYSVPPISHTVSNRFVGAHLPPSMPSNNQPNPSNSQLVDYQLPGMPYVSQANLSGSRVTLPSSGGLQSGQVSLSSHPASNHQSFSIGPQAETNSNNQPITQQSSMSAIPSNVKSDLNSSLSPAKKRTHAEYIEDELEQAAKGTEASSPNKKGKTK